EAIIRIYSASGVLVRVIEHQSNTFGGEATWNVRNRNNQVVASGVYFFHIESGEARKVGRFTLVNFAQSPPNGGRRLRPPSPQPWRQTAYAEGTVQSGASGGGGGDRHAGARPRAGRRGGQHPLRHDLGGIPAPR